MTTTAARPRALTVLIWSLLAIEGVFLLRAVAAALPSPGRDAMKELAHPILMLFLLGSMLVAQKHPRIAWVLVALSVVTIVTSAIVIPRLS